MNYKLTHNSPAIIITEQDNQSSMLLYYDAGVR